MMNLVLVTFDLDYTQFLVNASNYNLGYEWDCVKDGAIEIAIKAHIEWAKDQFGGFDDPVFGDAGVTLQDATDPDNYSVENVNMEMLLEIIKRKDWLPCLYGGAVVFGG